MSPDNKNANEDIGILILKAPEDPVEKRDWAHRIARLQIAMWHDSDPKNFKCAQCGIPYKDVDDYLARSPKAGYDNSNVDAKCWDSYLKRFR